MSYNSFFGDEESEYFDLLGRPKRPGIYEFQRYDGRKIIYTLACLEQDQEQVHEQVHEHEPANEAEAEPGSGQAGEVKNIPPRLKVVRASRLEDYPNPAHALDNLDGQWVRFLGDARQE